MTHLLFAGILGLAGVVQPTETIPAQRAVKEQERVVRLSLEAARSKEFYLVADVGSKSLALGIAGVNLASYRLESIEVGIPLTAGSPEENSNLQDLYACEAPVLRRPTEIVPGQPVPADLPDDPGASDDGHRRVVLDCEPSLTVSLIEGSALGRFEGLGDWLRLPWQRGADFRVRIFVEEEDADELFASIPPKFLLLFSRVPNAQPTGEWSSAR